MLLSLTRILTLACLLCCAPALIAGTVHEPVSNPDSTAVATQKVAPQPVKSTTRTFKVAPNPSNDVVEVMAPNTLPFSYFLYTNGGEMLQSGTAIPSESTLQLDLSKYPQGTYFLRVSTAGSKPELLPIVRR